MNKKKIFNDPVYGFISISSELIFDIVEHKFFQRLRRIKQLGLADYVYPGAHHTRFHHALGAMHLMGEALNSLRGKGTEISHQEFESAQLAILLHDIGHGPFSHALESSILNNVPHEQLSLLIIQKLNEEYHGALEMALQMFQNKYERPFFHQLIASQLDIDRLDYLQRDCFFTGVSEGTIGAERIIKMLDIVNERLVVEEKGIYSIENFLNARRLMYWQVYLHKTSVAAEQMLILIFNRAKQLSIAGNTVFGSEELTYFLNQDIDIKDIKNDYKLLKSFASIDDIDIWGAIKIWKNHDDQILSLLSKSLLDRRLFKITLQNNDFDPAYIHDIAQNISLKYYLSKDEAQYLYSHGKVSNSAYFSKGQHINIKTKNGSVVDVADASDLPNIKAISKIVKKYYLCCPKTLSLLD